MQERGKHCDTFLAQTNSRYVLLHGGNLHRHPGPRPFGKPLVPLRDIREVIAGDGPADETEAKRLALRATGRISNPDLAHDLYERLWFAMTLIGLDRAMGGDGAEGRREAFDALAEVEAASRPN